MTNSDWEALFRPHSSARLVEAILENRRLLLRTDQAEAMAALLPWETLNGLITVEDMVQGRLRMIRRATDMPLDMVSPRPAPGQRRAISPIILQQLCQQGLSLVFNSIESRVAAIGELAAMVERRLDVRTMVNAYASFRRESAFNPHYDYHNVLIVQIAGRKRWWCHGQVGDWPLAGRDIPPSSLPAAEWEGVLEPGDLLFVPRGDIHHAAVECEDEPCLHLTVTMNAPLGRDVAEWLVRRAVANEAVLRQDAPVLAEPHRQAEYVAALKAALHRQVDATDLGEFNAAQGLVRALARPFTLGLDSQLTPQTRIATTLRRRIALPAATAAGVTVSLGETTVRLTAAEREVLAALLERDSASLTQLCELFVEHDVVQAAIGLVRKSLAAPAQLRF